MSRSAMRDVVDIMALLVVQEKGKRGLHSAYEVDFEPVFLRKSEEFYKEEAESSLQALDASTYLRLVSESRGRSRIKHC
jgi:cullin 3